MSIEVIEFERSIYPKFQAQGFASQFAFPFAKYFCNGIGVDVGCNREEWKLPNAIAVDPAINPEYHAMNLPKDDLDFIFSSHCLEHLNDWTGVLDYWLTQIKTGGVIFLYLPHYSQKYWRTWNNRKHVNNLSPEMLKDYFESRKVSKIFVSGFDLNNSFYVVCEK